MSSKHAKKKKEIPKYKPREKGRGNPLTTDYEYDADEWEFIQAVEKYKKEKKRPFPSFAELLGVAKGLGYKKDKTS